MKSVIIISNGRPVLSQLAEVYGNIGLVSLQSSERLVVEGAWGWFGIGLDRELEGEFSEAERMKIASLIADPVYAQLEFSSPSALDLAIKLMPAAYEMLIDDDHGTPRPIC